MLRWVGGGGGGNTSVMREALCGIKHSKFYVPHPSPICVCVCVCAHGEEGGVYIRHAKYPISITFLLSLSLNSSLTKKRAQTLLSMSESEKQVNSQISIKSDCSITELVSDNSSSRSPSIGERVWPIGGGVCLACYCK